MSTTTPDSDPDETPEAEEVFAELQQLEMVVPLRDKALERLDEDIVVWIAGGPKVDGRLVAVNHDDTITVRDGKRVYDIALQAVAILEGDR